MDIWLLEQNFCHTGTELFKAIKLGLSLENQDEWDLCGADDIIAAYQLVMLLGPMIQILSYM
jgi:hypothetical protein